MKVYVLYEKAEYITCSTTLGVFDHTNISDDKLKTYFGEFKRVKFMDIRDSGVEWGLWIETSDGNLIRLYLYEYEINQLGE